MAAAQRTQLLVERQQASVCLPPCRQRVVARRVGPRIGLAIVRVIAQRVAAEAREPHFVTIEDGGGAREGELEHGGQRQARAAIDEVVGRLARGVVNRVVVEHAHGAIDVVAAEQVHGRRQRGGRVIFLNGAQRLVKLGGGEGLNLWVGCLRKSRIAQKAQDAEGEAVIHGGVELVAQHTLAHGLLGPRFGDQQRVRVHRLDDITEGLEEGGIHGHDVGHGVDAIAIHAGLVEPEIGNAFLAQPVFNHRLIGCVGLRQRGDAGKATVVCITGADAAACRLRRLNHVVGAPRAVHRLARTLLRPAFVAIKQGAVGGGVVRHGVEDEVHATIGHLLRKGVEVSHARGRVVTHGEAVLYLPVVARVIAVVRHRLVNRREVDGIDAQGLEVVQFLGDPLQVAAVESGIPGGIPGIGGIVGVRVGHNRVPRRNGEDSAALLGVAEVVHLGIIGRVAVAKTIREDLVDDGVLRPFGDLKIGAVGVDVPSGPGEGAHGKRRARAAVKGGRAPIDTRRVVSIVEGRIAVAHFKLVVVNDGRIAHVERRLPPGVAIRRGHRLHRLREGAFGGEGVDQQAHALDVTGRCAQAQRHGAAGGHGAEGRAKSVAAAVVQHGKLVKAAIARCCGRRRRRRGQRLAPHHHHNVAKRNRDGVRLDIEGEGHRPLGGYVKGNILAAGSAAAPVVLLPRSADRHLELIAAARQGHGKRMHAIAVGVGRGYGGVIRRP